MKQQQQQKYISSEKSNQTQLSLNLSKSQQKIFCKSIHEQIKERTQSKETTHRSTQNNQLSCRVKQQGSLSSVIANFFGPSGQKKEKKEPSENIEKSKIMVIKDLKNKLEEKDQQIQYLLQQQRQGQNGSFGCQKCKGFKEKLKSLKSSFSQQYDNFLISLDEDENQNQENIKQNCQISQISQKQQQSMQVLKSYIEKMSYHYEEMDDQQNSLLSLVSKEKYDLQQKVVQLEQKVKELQNNEQIMQKRLEQLQNPYQKYKNQLQQSASLTKLNSDIEYSPNLEKILNMGQPYLRTRYISQKENKPNQVSLI